ncbi:hypothetical protein GOV04_02160 [Candidatus Woesearchaeota archaeon]|nr:hypothetical protein [Candidatus Woesearchaeota archaeon]
MAKVDLREIKKIDLLVSDETDVALFIENLKTEGLSAHTDTRENGKRCIVIEPDGMDFVSAIGERSVRHFLKQPGAIFER